jgi:integrase/recombinase XerC
LTVRRGKGGKRRTVGLDAGTVALLEAWLARRQKLGIKRSARVLCTLQGLPLHDSYVRHAFRRLARKAEISKRVHPHGLRHAFTVELAKEGANIAVIRDVLGHSNISTTNTYLTRLSGGESLAFVRDRAWLGV